MSGNPNMDLLNQFEIGGNFFELIEFSLIRHIGNNRVYKGTYGVNVAKVREVVHMPTINPLASSVPGVSGVFELRGIPIPAVNLPHILGDNIAPINQNQQIIVTEFSQKRAGFIVNSTHRIRRVSWDKVLPPSSDASSCMTGMILMDNKEFLFILDLERILCNLDSLGSPAAVNVYNGSETNQIAAPAVQSQPDPHSSPGILVVDDSRLILNNLNRTLSDAGFRVITAENGQQALDRLNSIAQGSTNIGPVNAIISDVEMPQMDGLTFVRKLRDHPDFSALPVLLHTSLDGKATKEAADKIGANGYVVKNDINDILHQLSELLSSSEAAVG